MRFRVLAAAQAAAIAIAVPALAESGSGEGSLYPAPLVEVDRDALAEALGPARYILDDIAAADAFRQTVRRAVGLHPVLHREVSGLAQARAAARAERAALYPRLSASLNGDYVIARDFGPDTDNVVESLRPDAQFNAGVSVSQLLFDGGATFARVRSAHARGRAEAEGVNARVNELALAALSAYHDLATHQAILKIGEAFIRRHEDLLEHVRERERLGAGARAEVMQASARLAAARARVAQIRESTRLAEVRYQSFFRVEPGVLARVKFDASDVATRGEAMALALANNPEAAAARALSQSAAADHRALRASRYPEVRANVSAVKYDAFDGDDYDVRAGVSMNYDLFSGGARGARIAGAAEAARRQRHDESRVRQEIERDAAIAYERRRGADERVAALADAVIANYRARNMIFERFRAARGDLIDLLQAENDYFESGVAYLAGLADRDMAVYELMEHTGELLRQFSPQSEYDENAG